MSTRSMRTIDDLGLETSVRYASDLANLDTSLLRESPSIPTYVQVDVWSPEFHSQTDTLTGAALRNLPYPDFYPPTQYNIQMRPIFTHQLLPSLGSDEKLTTHIDRIHAIIDRERDKKKKKGNEWEEQQEEEEEKRESHALLLFLELLQNLDKVLRDVTAGRNLYQKG